MHQIFQDGPNKEKSSFLLYPDGRTESEVDLTRLGGLTAALSRFERFALMTYLRKKGENDIYMTAERKIRRGNMMQNILLTEISNIKIKFIYFFHI